MHRIDDAIPLNPLIRASLGAQGDNIAMRRMVTHSIPNEPKKNRKLRHKLSLAFTADVPEGKEYRYKLSIAINEALSEEVSYPFSSTDRDPGAPRHKKIAGTVYPAMRMHGDADNAVFLPEFVDSSLRIIEVLYVKVEQADEVRSAYTWLIVASATHFDGDKIEWQDRNEPEDRRRSHIVFENGHWIMRDGYNNIYYTH
jgi:hypothetical protein